jgi:hypothetical protein
MKNNNNNNRLLNRYNYNYNSMPLRGRKRFNAIPTSTATTTESQGRSKLFSLSNEGVIHHQLVSTTETMLNSGSLENNNKNFNKDQLGSCYD